MRIYIESTIPSYVVARPAHNIVQAARQQITQEWWEVKRGEHELFVSQVVLDEIAFGDTTMVPLRMDLVQEIPLLELTNDVREFARKVLGSGLLPRESDRDAAHIALATVHEMDLLLSWNCRYVANAAIQTRLRRLAEAARPEELLGDSYE
jgi:hypothetical protein